LAQELLKKKTIIKNPKEIIINKNNNINNKIIFRKTDIFVIIAGYL